MVTGGLQGLGALFESPILYKEYNVSWGLGVLGSILGALLRQLHFSIWSIIVAHLYRKLHSNVPHDALLRNVPAVGMLR